MSGSGSENIPRPAAGRERNVSIEHTSVKYLSLHARRVNEENGRIPPYFAFTTKLFGISFSD